MAIITVPNIELNDGRIQVLTAKGTWVDLHYQQGEIDGACAVYSVAFCMLYEQMVNDISAEGRSKGDRLLKELFDKHGMIRPGFHFGNLRSIIERYKKKSWTVDVIEGKQKTCVDGIVREIDGKKTPIIGIDYKECTHGHAMLAVAYEYDEEDCNRILRIFCLDPSAPAPRTAIWNSYIDVRDLRKPCTHINDNPLYAPAKCRLTDYLLLHDAEREEEWS